MVTYIIEQEPGQPKWNREGILMILAQINYKPDWKLRLLEKGDGYLLQWTFMEKDLTNPDPNAPLEEQFGRKWYISPYMTTSEVIRTAYLAVIQAEMHEIGERFTFQDTRIFDPHMNLLQLEQAIFNEQIGVDNRIPKQK